MKNVYSRGGVLIGNVPDTWTVNKTLRCLDMPITDGPHETPSAVDEIDGIPFVSAEAVSCGNGSIDFEHIWGFISKEYYKECCKKYIPRIDDIYMIKSGATTGKVAIVDTERIFTIWSPLAVFRANTFIIKPKYLFYFLQSSMYLSQVELGWNYGTQQNIGMRALEQLYISYPSLTEQQQIVHFLDRKCTAIDTAIEKTKKSIEKLEEYKKAVITKAVTKGIDPNVKMKDSGVEWIGEIPEGWEVKQLRTYFSRRINKNIYLQESNLLSLSYGHIVRKNIDTKEGLLPESFDGYNIVEDGDIVIRGTDLQNDHRSLRTGLVTERGIITSAYITLKPKEDVNSVYYHYLLHCYDISKVFYSMGGGLRQSLDYWEFIRMPVLYPTDREQEKIISYIKTKCTAIDAAIEKKKKAIEKWEEYKKSLIYYAVTGKIDCRGEKL